MRLLPALVALLVPLAASAREYHVAVGGDDSGDGSRARPLRTISAAARLAQPGDVITVHAGTYRERVSPPRGGDSDARRITYRAAPGEKAIITGSEVVKGWEPVGGDTWKVALPNAFFGSFNPYSDRIHGDWFNGNGREHHTGAVYLNGHWLIEARTLEEVLAPRDRSETLAQVGGDPYLLNVAWLRPDGAGAGGSAIAATACAARHGTQDAECSEGGGCIGFIRHGHWVRYDGVDFGRRSQALEIRAASASEGGVIEVRDGSPEGPLLGRCEVPNTGGWQSWLTFRTSIQPVSGVRSVALVFRRLRPGPPTSGLWFAKVDAGSTTIWAQFPQANPNEQLVEINVRQTVFTPEKPGVDYITLRGFTLRHAATPWAPPTAAQIGLVSAFWCKGWIIEDNDISYSRCSGIALGKYGDEWDNRAESAQGYVGTLTRALANGWNKATVGSHLVRNNRISHCEQAGIVGSLGCAFSTVAGNEIRDIHVQKLFTGAEMAGIKFHGAIDVVIHRNHIYRCGSFGIWLDWMAQGAQITACLLHDNSPHDLFHEVNHGPFLVANNILLSPVSQLMVSQGGAYAHNLIGGGLHLIPFDSRETPFHRPHSTEVVRLHNNPCGDMRYHNNILFDRGDLSPYDSATLPVQLSGNVFLKGAKPCRQESAPLVRPDYDPQVRLIQRGDEWHMAFRFDPGWRTAQPRVLVTTELLGLARIPGVPFENRDGSPLRIDTDYLGARRNSRSPFPGPFEIGSGGAGTVRVWPVKPEPGAGDAGPGCDPWA